jgi:hypothetical protein
VGARLPEAEARYRRIAAAGGSADAEKGGGARDRWRGDLAASERLWRELSTRYPRDPEA